MLRLWLLRHAKSGWDDPALDDFARPLAPRGRKACRRLGRHLTERGVAPDLILASPAARTRETLERIRTHLPAESVVRFEPRLYLAETPTLLAVLRAAPKDCRELMLIGHNPGLEDLAAALCPEGAGSALDRLREKYPTGGLAEIAFTAKRWADLGPQSGYLSSFVVPAQLGDED